MKQIPEAIGPLMKFMLRPLYQPFRIPSFLKNKKYLRENNSKVEFTYNTICRRLTKYSVKSSNLPICIQLRINSTEYFSSVIEFWIFHNFREIDSQC